MKEDIKYGNDQIKIFINKMISYFDYTKEGTSEYLGLEVEHYIVNRKSKESLDYFAKNGSKHVLEELLKKEWKDILSENGNILGIEKAGTTITLEPGGQIEISIKPCKKIEEIKEIYISVMNEIENELSDDLEIVAMGYHPKSKIDELKILPKSRYRDMVHYFAENGKYSHNMMKGTAATQVSIDYFGQEDFIKKYRTANFLSPFISRLFDASPVFEGEIFDKDNLRILIWQHTGSVRSKMIKGTFDGKMGYESYAKYVMTVPPVQIKYGKEYLYTAEITLNDFIENGEYYELVEIGGELTKIDKKLEKVDIEKIDVEHILGMIFPDVRLKQFIEIRMADSIDFPYSMAVPALVKGIFYNSDNLEKYYKLSLEFSDEDMIKLQDMFMDSLDFSYKTIESDQMSKELLRDAKKGLCNKESVYIEELEKLINEHGSMARKLKEELSEK